MQQTRQVKPSFKSALEEHRLLRSMAEELRHFCERERPALDAEEAPEWANGLSRRLLEFHDKVSHHFREEEDSGMLQDICRSHPNFSRSVAAFEEEHERILADLRAALDAAMLYSENKPPERQDLRRWTLSVLDLLGEHERAETDLIYRTLNEDLGTGD